VEDPQKSDWEKMKALREIDTIRITKK